MFYIAGWIAGRTRYALLRMLTASWSWLCAGWLCVPWPSVCCCVCWLCVVCMLNVLCVQLLHCVQLTVRLAEWLSHQLLNEYRAGRTRRMIRLHAGTRVRFGVWHSSWRELWRWRSHIGVGTHIGQLLQTKVTTMVKGGTRIVDISSMEFVLKY